MGQMAKAEVELTQEEALAIDWTDRMAAGQDKLRNNLRRYEGE
jgi:hypothetical protein